MSGPPSPVTLEDVARASGYSRATVSRVVNKHASVDRQIAQKVDEAIEALGYVTNPSARALAGGATMTIGLVFTEPFRELFRNPYWGAVVEGISAVLWEAEYQMVFLIRDELQRRRVETYLMQHHVDGVVLVSAPRDDDLESTLVKRGFPVVLCGTPFDPSAMSSATIDELQVGRVAAQRLVARGCRNPVVISGRDDMRESHIRPQSFVDSVGDSGIILSPDRILSGDFTEAGGSRAMSELLDRVPDLDGVFACSDRMAIGALNELHERGRRVPDDVALIGVDGTLLGDSARPRLTSVGCDMHGLGRELAALILGAIQGDSVKRVIFPPYLVVRETA